MDVDVYDVREKFNIPLTVKVYRTPYYGVFLGIQNIDDSRYVIIFAPLYVNKVWKVSFSFSTAFSDGQILSDNKILSLLSKSYGKIER